MTVMNKITVTFTAGKKQPFVVVREQTEGLRRLYETFDAVQSLDEVMLLVAAFVGAQRGNNW